MIQVFKNIKNDSKQSFSINVQFQKDRFTLLVIENTSAWQAIVSSDDVGEFADEFNLSNEEYFLRLKSYLEDTPENIELSFIKREFICYSKAKNGINLKYFSTKPHKVDVNFNQLLQSYSQESEKLRKQNASIISERNHLREAKTILENKLKELVTRKINDEEELYSNFVLALNEKKRRIQHLGSLLQAFKSGRPLTNPIIKSRAQKKKEVKKELNNEVSESDSESTSENNYNTDEENLTEIVQNNPKKKQTFDSVFDDPVSSNLPKKSKFTDFIEESDEEKPLTSKVQNKKLNNFCEKRDEETPSTSKFQNEKPSSSKIQKEKTSVKVQEEKLKVDEMEVDKDSPDIGFNTQDLLDCI